MGWIQAPTGNAGGWTPAPKPPRAARPPKPHLPPKPHAPHRPPAPYDPFAPKTLAQLQAEASATGAAGLAPIVKQITDAINARSAAGQSAIGGLTKSLGGLFSQAGPQTAAAYQQAQTAQSGINNQLANRLTAYGGNLANEQGNQLASINAPQATNAQTAQTAQTGTGAANAGFAEGNANISSLIAHGANAQAYAAQLPGIAGLTGLQNSRQFQAQLNHELGAQLSAAQAQAAQNVASTYAHLQDLEFQKAQASRVYGASQAKVKYDQMIKQQELKFQRDKAHWQKTVALLNAHTSQKKAATGQQNANTSASKAAESGRHNRASESNAQRRARIAQQNANTSRWKATHPKGGKGKKGPNDGIPPP